jgi:transposase
MQVQPDLNILSANQLRTLAAQLLVAVEQKSQVNRHLEAVNEKLAHEIAILRRYRFARRSETLNPHPARLAG